MTSAKLPAHLLALAVALGASVALGGCGWKLETRGAGEGEGEARAAEAGAPEASARTSAPDFSLPNDDGTFVSLADLVAGEKPAILVFYRGHW